jgi:GTPase SAR1 family protein
VSIVLFCLIFFYVIFFYLFTRLILSRNSFTSIAKWIADARKLAGADIALMLVGNKLDLEDREVTYLEASRFAQENGMYHHRVTLAENHCMGANSTCKISSAHSIDIFFLQPACLQ